MSFPPNYKYKNDIYDVADKASSLLEKLSKREYQVLIHIVSGHPNKLIAYQLGISQRTAENHRANIMRKTGCKSLPSLVALAFFGTRGCLARCTFLGFCSQQNSICILRQYSIISDDLTDPQSSQPLHDFTQVLDRL